MANEGSECGLEVLLLVVLVFGLPLTVFIPDFLLWDFVPKISVSRLHIVSYDLTWEQMHSVLLVLIGVFFLIFLEIRRRKLDEMLSQVLEVSQATDETLSSGLEQQDETTGTCAKLLDGAAEHYEHLMLLRDDILRNDACRRETVKQGPPEVEPSLADDTYTVDKL